MAIDLTELKAELDTTYAGQTDGNVRNAINDPAGPNGATIDRVEIPNGELQASVDGTEYLALTNQERDLWQAMLTVPALPINTITKDQVQKVWVGHPITIAAIGVLQQKTGSHAEVLWGDGVVVSLNHILEARSL